MYENLLNSISNNELDKFLGDTLKEKVLSSIGYEKIQKQVSNLSKKVKNEKQFNRQVELNAELKELKKKINSILKRGKMMEKMRMESLNLTSQNVEKIEALFPNCITETKDENGKLKKSINFKMLKQMLLEDIVDGEKVYELSWVEKKHRLLKKR